MNLLVALLAFFGALICATRAYEMIKSIISRLAIPAKHPMSYGKVAVVTGATDGIGKAISFELAKKGCDLILISRTQSKLEQTKSEIQSMYSEVSVDVLAVDYSTFSISSKSFEQVSKLFKDKRESIGILVNNVGMSYPFPQYFHELSNEQVSNLISLNVTSTTLMTKLFLDSKLEKSDASKNLVVNIGSFAGVFPSPLLTQYSAAKAYVETFTRSLSVEYETKGFEFQCHVPLYIVSKMSKIRKGSMMVPTSEEYAQMVVGNFGKGVVISPHFLQNFLTEVLKLIPYSTLMSRVKQIHLGIRAKGLKKLEREKTKTK